jgi:hypothetical protein
VKNVFRSTLWVATTIVFLWVLGGCSKGSSTNNASSAPATQPAAPATAQAPPPIIVPAETEIHVDLDTALSSRDNQSGDTFEATVTEPIVIDGQTAVPRHARVRGVVVQAQASGRLSKPAMLAVTLKSIQLGGAWVDLHTHDLTMQASSHEKRDAIAIGGGSALGAVIGGIAGHGKGAAIGALAGGGAGTAGAAATGKKDISLPAESHATFRLSRSLSVQPQ